jgi:hypothetical protein
MANHFAVGLSELFSAMAKEANKTRRYIEQQKIAYQMPEFGTDLKLALTAIRGGRNQIPRLRVAAVTPGEHAGPVSRISSKFTACPTSTAPAIIPELVSHHFENGALSISFNVSGVGADHQVEANLNRELARQLNNQPLLLTTRINIPIVKTDPQGQFAIVVDVASGDQAGIKLPLELLFSGVSYSYLFTTS